MANTIMQDIVDVARLDISDSSKDRYSDDEMLKYANDAIAQALVMRSDLNWGNYNTQFQSLALTDDFPLNPEYRRAIEAYVVAMAETADDEFVNEGRAALGLKEYMSGLGLAQGE